MYALIDAAINRSRTTLLILAMIVIAGVAADRAILVESEPHIEVPFFVVTIPHEGISPEDSERLLVMPMETEMRTIEGIKELTSYSSEGAGTLLIEFNADYPLAKASIDVRDAVDRAKAKLPSTAKEPIVQEQNANDFPIIQINLLGDDVPERVIYNVAVQLRDDIEAIPEVLSAELNGHREEVLEALIDPTALESYQISNEQLWANIVNNNRLIAAGALDTGQGRFAVKVPSVIERAQDIFDIPVKSEGDTVVTLRDVAQIRPTFKDRISYARVNGKPAMSLNVSKRTNANVIDTVAKVRAVVEEARPRIPSHVEILYTQDQAPFAQQQVTELQGNIITALALVMVVVVATMGVRSGIIVALSVPVSFLFALTTIYVIGYTYNFMVMFGLLLGLGLVVDGAIVVTEYADRKLVEGFDKHAAYSLAAKRMFWPVVTSTGATLAAFLPLMFWPGIAGKFMRYLPVTVFASLTGSLVYALIIGPCLGALFGKAGSVDPKTTAALKELEEGDPTKLRGLMGWYSRIAERAVRFAPLTCLLMVGTLIGSFMLWGAFGKGMVFFNDGETQFAQVTVKSRGNLAADQMNRLVNEVGAHILEVRGIKSLNSWTTMSGDTRRGLDRIGQMFLEIVDENERDRSSSSILEEIRTRTKSLAGVTVEVKAMEQGPRVGKPIALEFRSRDRRLLEPAVERVRNYMDTQVEGLRDIDDTRAMPGIEWKLDVDRAQAALFGVDVSQVGMAVQLVTNGLKVGEYRPDGSLEEVDIRVRYPSSERGLLALDELKINTGKGQVPISSFVKRTPAPRVDTFQRIDGVPVYFIRADVARGVLADAKVKEIQAWIDAQSWDPSLRIEFKGANKEQAESMQFISIAFLLAVLLMFVMLVAQFNSIYQAFLIVSAVVMSTAGVLLGLVIMGKPFSAILTGVGVVALAGIVVNHNIILISAYNHLKREHPELDYIALIVRAGSQRVRPVMLTTIVTILGLLPMAFNMSVDFVNRSIVFGSQMSMFWVPLSQAIVWGLTFATVLTLVCTPAMMALPQFVQRLFRRRPPGGVAANVAPSTVGGA
jgi:multidrug efflux pump